MAGAGIGSPSPRPRNGEPCRFLAPQAMGDGQQRPTPVPDAAPVVVQVLREGNPRFGVAFPPRPGTVSNSHKLAAWGWSARHAVPTPMPSCWEMTRHEAPVARSAATCLASTAVRGRPNFLPFDLAAAKPMRTRERMSSRSNSAMLAKIPGTTISPTTITRMAPICLRASAGFTRPRISS